MGKWPSFIPHDLKLALEASTTHEQWWQAFNAWSKTHALRIKLHWMRVLVLDLAELDRYRTPPTDQDRWSTIKEWLERHGVEAPDRLPAAPEPPGGKFV